MAHPMGAHVGFQKGHPPLHNGFPGHSGGNRTRGVARATQCGFQKGHPAYYSGGSVKGHAPTNRKGNAESVRPYYMDPKNPYRFDQPLGREHQKRSNGRPRKSKERQCLEALQNGKDPAELEQNFPAGMIRRLDALSRVAENEEHRDFIHANRLLRDILGTDKVQTEEDQQTREEFSVTVVRGHIEAPLPGDPGAPVDPSLSQLEKEETGTGSGSEGSEGQPSPHPAGGVSSGTAGD